MGNANDYEQFKELATNTMGDIMTPAQKIRAKAEKVSKDLVTAYEVGATMKDLDGVVSMWTGIVEKALLEVPELVKPKPDVQTAMELRDRATQVALNFVGHRISSSDGSYSLLIDCVSDALNQTFVDGANSVPQVAVTAEAERQECLKILQKAYQEWFDGDHSPEEAFRIAKDRIRARSEK